MNTGPPQPNLDIDQIRADFPMFAEPVNGRRLTYLDSSATSQKPLSVLDAMDDYYRHANANVHRGAYYLSDLASRRMESARDKVAHFIGADDSAEIVFTKNATEALNLVAHTWGRQNLASGDAVVLSMLEHHANIVPWQMLAQERDIELRFLPIDRDAKLELDDIERYLDGAKLLSITAMSNVVGTLVPIQRLARLAHDAGALICVDACQYVPHLPTDVEALGVDFLCFSGHKMCGPTGVGVLWARKNLLEEMPPFLGGGGMISNVTTEGFSCAQVPHKFEAGTPPIAEIVGLGAAVDYLNRIGMTEIRRHAVELSAYLMRTVSEHYGNEVTIHGPSEPSERGAVFSFSYKDMHPHDLSQVLDDHGVSIRAGHHCAKPLMSILGVGSTARASLYLYNDRTDVDVFVKALGATADLFDF